ncbi:MAG: flagellar hook assembly protein FlgD [Cycloclasticus sp.]|nr:flagellar hook assembly protein FlgD [Cycloclasticus sp.]MBQ0789593.1 flagellar hook assembly protein FlgD [Cycloclasticus sp.]
MSEIDFNTLQGLGLAKQTQVDKAKKDGDLGQADFLELMVTQLKNQDPLDPMDSGAFLGQIAQFSTVSGIGDLQTSFSEFASSVANDQALQASNLVGRRVIVPLQNGVLNEGGAIEGEVTLPASSPDVSINISNQNGELIKTISLGTQAAGPVPFKWDGSLNNGGVAPAGQYSVDAIARIDGQNFELDTQLLVDVESVTLGGPGRGLQLNLAGLGSVDFSNVSRIF